VVFRYTFGDTPALRENTLGARWNPPDVAAIYTSLKHETLLAEMEYRLGLDPVTPTRPANIFKIKVVLGRVVDLRDPQLFRNLGIDPRAYSDDDLGMCQRIGRTVEWLECEGLMVPSARHAGANLVMSLSQEVCKRPQAAAF